MQSSEATQITKVKASILITLGIEFTRSHGLEYAKGLLELLGADDDTMHSLIQHVVAERCTEGSIRPIGKTHTPKTSSSGAKLQVANL